MCIDNEMDEVLPAAGFSVNDNLATYYCHTDRCTSEVPAGITLIDVVNEHFQLNWQPSRSSLLAPGANTPPVIPGLTIGNGQCRVEK